MFNLAPIRKPPLGFKKGLSDVFLDDFNHKIKLFVLKNNFKINCFKIIFTRYPTQNSRGL